MILILKTAACKTDTQENFPIGKKAKLMYVVDGDTQLYSINGEKFKVRLLHIDTPEMTAPKGLEAKEYVIKLKIDSVELIHTNQFDKYNRLLAEVKLKDGKILNQMLVKDGFATHFKRYSKSILYANLEREAQTKHLGIWTQKNY